MAKNQNRTLGLTVFYDGWCKLCSGVVGLLLKTKAGRELEYIPLQQINDFFKDSLLASCLEDVNGDEIIVYKDGFLTGGAEGVLIILKSMGGIYKLMYWTLNLLPSKWLEKGYVFIAQNRYRWFGKKETCNLIN